MFLDIIMQLFAGCSNPIEYVTAFIFFYMCVCVCACVRGRGGALLSLIGMFTNLSNANIKVSSWLLKGNV